MSADTRRDSAIAALERALHVLALREPAGANEVGTIRGDGPASPHLKISYVDGALREALELLRPLPRVSRSRALRVSAENEHGFRRADAERSQLQRQEARKP